MENQQSLHEADVVTIDVADLVVQHHRAMYAYAFRLSGNATDAEDLVQQAFLTVQQKGHQIRKPSAARGWLFTVLRNCFLKNCRRRGPELAENLDLDLDRLAGFELDNQWFDAEKIQAALDELPPRYRVVVLMFYFEDLSYREIAEQIDIPIGTVMSRLSRAKCNLRSTLSEVNQSATAAGESDGKR